MCEVRLWKILECRAIAKIMQIVQLIRRNGRREVRSVPLNCHLCAAVGSATAAEMAQMPRKARVYPPPAIWDVAAANVGEQSAENAQANAMRINRRDAEIRGKILSTKTPRHNDTKVDLG